MYRATNENTCYILKQTIKYTILYWDMAYFCYMLNWNTISGFNPKVYSILTHFTDYKTGSCLKLKLTEVKNTTFELYQKVMKYFSLNLI